MDKCKEHGELIDVVDDLNTRMQRLSDAGLDVRVEVTGVDNSLRHPKNNPQITVRVTELLPYASRGEGDVVAFKPQIVTTPANKTRDGE